MPLRGQDNEKDDEANDDGDGDLHPAQRIIARDLAVRNIDGAQSQHRLDFPVERQKSQVPHCGLNELPVQGNAYESDAPTVPTNIYEARDLLAESEVAHEAFGGSVVAHYLNRATVEIEAMERSVTDWERFRGFERL